MKRLYWHLLFGAVITFGTLAILMLSARLGLDIDIVTLIVLAGAIGAVVNNYFRLAKMIESKAEPTDDGQQRLVIVQIYVSMLIAGILAFVAYGMFLSGLIQGSLFPAFDNTQSTYKGITALLTGLGPKANIDATKSILWAFFAGFSERFVPNIIDTLIAKASK